MNNDSLQTSFWVMVLVQTIGSVDMPGRGARKMPAPRQYVAILVTWLVLQVAASIGDNAQRAATAIGWFFVLTGMVIGPFGQRTISFFSTIAQNFSNTPITAPSGVSTTPSTGSVNA